MLNFILKNTEMRAVPEECGHATVISITERKWYNYTVVGVTARQPAQKAVPLLSGHAMQATA